MPGYGYGYGYSLYPGGGQWLPTAFGSDLKLWLRPEELNNPNRLLQTEDLTDAAWAKSNTTVASGQPDPEGGNTAFKLTATGFGWVIQEAQGFQPGTNDVCSFWWKRGPGHDGTSKARPRLHDGVGFIADELIVPPADWTRYEMTGTLSAGATKSTMYLHPDNDAPPDQSLLIWHPQLESGTSATAHKANAATAGGIVALHEDQSPSGNDATQAVQANMALVLAAALDGYSAALNDGLTDDLDLATQIDLAGAFDYWAVLQILTDKNYNVLLGTATDAIRIGSTGIVELVESSAATALTGVSALTADAAYHLLRVSRDASNNVLCEVDGVDVTSGSPSVAGTVSITNLRSAVSGNWFDGLAVEDVLVAADAASDRDNLLGYFGRYSTLGL